MIRESLLEMLEARIAPALFFLSGAGKAVVNQSGISVNDSAAQALAGSDIAVALNAGDSLFLDADGSVATTGDRTLLLSVTAGHSIVFATDLGAMPNGHFDANEITGLAVADSFEAKLQTGVRGSIVTALNDDGTLAVSGSVLSVRHQSINGLNIDGDVAGNIFAGGDVRHVRVTGSVSGNIATGTAVNESSSPLDPVALSLNGGGITLSVAAFATPDGVRGGDISDVQLAGGAKNLLAGKGDDTNTTVPGRGGSISNVAMTVDSTAAPVIRAGDGGSSNAAAGARGGSLTGITINLASDGTESLQLLAGAGGRGTGKGSGGAGGSITDCTIISTGSLPSSSLEVRAGAGGEAEETGAGGAGGSISDTSIHLLDAANVFGSLVVKAGRGGDSADGAGGAGGVLRDLTLFAEASIGDGGGDSLFEIAGGAGGAGKTRGGAGGAISGGTLHLLGEVLVPETAKIQAGEGGALQDTATASSVAGRGGAISGVSISLLADLNADLVIAAGNGGSAGGASAGDGGAGGRLAATISGRAGENTAMTLQAGAGGAAPSGSGDGGAGGSIAETTVNLSGALGSFVAQAGAGADGGESDGAGGAGGGIRSFRLVLGEVVDEVRLQAGDAGVSRGAAGAAGGNVAGLRLTNTGELQSGLQILAGQGGSPASDGAGGGGGSVLNSSVMNAGGMDFLTVTAGDGGNANGDGATGSGGGIINFTLKSFGDVGVEGATFTAGVGGDGGSSKGGGAGGSIRTLSVNLLDAPLKLLAGNGGDSSTAKAGGVGGAIRDITGSVDTATIIAGNGGNSTSGTGGKGGGVRDVSLGLVGTFVRAVLAGNGGDGATAGAGGSVRSISIAGDIGDFTSDFDFAVDDDGDIAGMGGIAAGQAGTAGSKVAVTKNGSIINVSAARIAAMVAGRPDAESVTNANAVRKIAKITAARIGADANGDGDFDPGTFVPGGAVAAEDGFILVRAGSLSLLDTAVVLKVFSV